MPTEFESTEFEHGEGNDIHQLASDNRQWINPSEIVSDWRLVKMRKLRIVMFRFVIIMLVMLMITALAANNSKEKV